MALAHITPNEDRYVDRTVTALEKLIERARNGEIISFVGIIELKGGGYIQVGPGCPDRHRQAGMLLDLAISRIIED